MNMGKYTFKFQHHQGQDRKKWSTFHFKLATMFKITFVFEFFIWFESFTFYELKRTCCSLLLNWIFTCFNRFKHFKTHAQTNAIDGESSDISRNGTSSLCRHWTMSSHMWISWASPSAAFTSWSLYTCCEQQQQAKLAKVCYFHWQIF